AVLDRRGVGEDGQSLGERRLARGKQPRRVGELHQAHPAVGGDGEPRMVAVVRDVRADPVRRLDHVGARLHHDFLAVDGAGDEARVLRRHRCLCRGWRSRDWFHPRRARRIARRSGRGLAAFAGDGQLRVLFAHGSTWPPIMLIVSKVGMRSASSLPSTIRGTPERMANEGERTWTLYGRPLPSLTRYQPSSPLAASVESYTSPAGTWMPSMISLKCAITPSIVP